jgi:hypothetical protein
MGFQGQEIAPIPPNHRFRGAAYFVVSSIGLLGGRSVMNIMLMSHARTREIGAQGDWCARRDVIWQF